MNSLRTLLRPRQPVPAEYRSTFFHLYLDITWFGVLSGSSMAYIAIYAARLGGDGQQIGLINAAPAIVNLLFALPAGRWLAQRKTGSAVFWTSIYYRIFYLLWVPLPWLFASQSQIWAIIATTLLMSIPGTALSVGFNALFAEAVPPEWRGYVAGVRNAAFAVTTTLTSLLSGYLLVSLHFPVGYQVVFALGFLGAMMSSFHLWSVYRHTDSGQAGHGNGPPEALSAPGGLPISNKRARVRFLNAEMLRFAVLKGPFGRLVMLLFFFHLAQYFPVAVFTIYLVDALHFSDQMIGIGSAVFYAVVFIGSTQLARWSSRYGNRVVTGVGATLMAFYPALLAITHGVGLFVVTSAVGGLAWSLAGGALYNYLLENVPPHDRPAHLAWYNLALNAAILIGSLVGPFVAGLTGLSISLFLFAVIRLFAGASILRWGRSTLPDEGSTS